MRALIHTADNFRQFSRNGRWGTCVDCPRSEGRAYPEFCPNTDSYDHQLDVDSLARIWKQYNMNVCGEDRESVERSS